VEYGDRVVVRKAFESWGVTMLQGEQGRIVQVSKNILTLEPHYLVKFDNGETLPAMADEIRKL
jgi:hypothetical protein